MSQRTNGSGAVLSTDLYDAFGNKRSGPADVFGFGGQAGYYTDAETGLILCTHRHYDPQQGRFLTRDPLGYAGGINLYSYTANNPVNWLDPSGTSPLSDWYMGGMGGTSNWVDQHLMFGTASHFGNVTGNYDSGRASGLQVAGAGAEAFGMGLANAIPVARGVAWLRAGMPWASVYLASNARNGFHLVYGVGEDLVHSSDGVVEAWDGGLSTFKRWSSLYGNSGKPFLRVPVIYPQAVLRTGQGAQSCLSAAASGLGRGAGLLK